MSFLPKQCVVVPVDFSSSSASAVTTALELAGDAANVHVMHVIPALNPISPIGIWGDAGAEEQLATRAKQYLDTFLASHGIQGVTSAIEIGQAGNSIVKYAEKHKADLIVIPSHGHSGLQRAFVGSVAERVIRHADCPTLVLRRKIAE